MQKERKNGSAANFNNAINKMADQQSVILEVINTKHKKAAGILRLLSNNLIWIPHGSDNPKLSCAYSEIKGKPHHQCHVL